MLRRLELDRSVYFLLSRRCAELGIDFLATAFDAESLTFLTHDLGASVVKIASSEITNGPLLVAAGRSGARIILSTGMSTLDDIEDAVGAICYGALEQRYEAPPGSGSFRGLRTSSEGRRVCDTRLTLLHCVTEYPASIDDTNLRALDTLRDVFGVPVGLSDHTTGTTAAIAAVARGASMIEKHLTLDRTLPGPDHAASMLPGELKDLVRAVREVERALGSGVKAVAPSEAVNLAVARRSLVALRDIEAGQSFTAENLGFKRPGVGISPMKYWEYLGRPAARPYAADELIDQ
jgi:N-acetylneuraminate synthase